MSIRFVFILMALCLVFIVGLVFLTGSGVKPPSKFRIVSATDSARPRAEPGETSANLGNMKVSEVRQYDFTITNKGNTPLQIGYLSSSCSCTVGQIIYNGKTSREYGMHDPGQDIVEVSPNTSAVVRVIYRPSVMPVYGTVEREVYLQTNDPEKNRLVLKVAANVQ